jgi:formamidopyrimidine-DNA glycosylase
MEAYRRLLDTRVRAAPVQKAGPVHVATLKSFDPPLSALDGRRLAGAQRRGKHLLLPSADGELVLHIHLMSAGRLAFLEAGSKGPKRPAFQLLFEDGGMLVLTERGSKKRARVGLYRPDVIAAELEHLGPEALGIGAERLADILGAEPHRLHPLLRDQRALAGIGRAWSNEILNRARLSPYALSTDLDTEEIERLASAIDGELERGLVLREQGAGDAKVYRVHDRLGQPCPQCGTQIARIDFEEHTIYYCPECQTSGRVLKDRRLSRLLK